MLLHLPIAIMATLSPIPVADTVPTFDIARECRYEGVSAANVDQCSRDEAAALRQLKTEWVQFVGADKRSWIGRPRRLPSFRAPTSATRSSRA